MRHQMEKTGSRKRADRQSDHPHQTLLVASSLDERHDDGAAERAKADDGDEYDAVANAYTKRHAALRLDFRCFRRWGSRRDRLGSR